MAYCFYSCLFISTILLVVVVDGNEHHRQRRSDQWTVPGLLLYEELFEKYNKYILPVHLNTHNVDIRLLLRLVQLTDIDERNQVMTTTVWVKHEWHDAGLVWNPKYYGNITKLQLPANEVWTPDTVLYNNADGDYQITTQTKVTVYNDGRVGKFPFQIVIICRFLIKTISLETTGNL